MKMPRRKRRAPPPDGQFPAFFHGALRIFIMSQSAVAPEKMRMNVKLAASILVCLSASRQSREFPANAIIAISVRMKIRVGFTAFSREVKFTPREIGT